MMKLFEPTEDSADEENCDLCVWVMQSAKGKTWKWKTSFDLHSHLYIVKKELTCGEAP